MADDHRRPRAAAGGGIATHDHADTPSSRPETRSPSTSTVGMSESGREGGDNGRSIQASVTSMEGGSRGARPRPLDYGSMQGSVRSRPQQAGQAGSMLSPQLSQQTPKRPTTRRAPSAIAPHRGQEFSVDDDPDEVDLDLRLSRTHTKSDNPRDRQLRRRESTLRRRPTAQPPTLTTVESEEREEGGATQASGNDASYSSGNAQQAPVPQADSNGEPSSEETLQGEEEEEEPQEPDTPEDEEDDNDDDDDADLSDAESFTLKDRQEAINETHPFGIRIWKPALYKKNRSVQRNAEGDIHSAPGGNVSRWLFIFNCLWTVIFGWWLSLLAGFGGAVNLLLWLAFSIQSCHDYGRVLINLAHYLLYPFGKYVKLERDEQYLDEDEGEGRSISEYERWQTGDIEEGRLFFGPTDINRSIIGRRRDEVEDLDPQPDETDSLLGRQQRQSNTAKAARSKTKKRLFGRGKWNLGRVIFFLSFYVLLTPCLFLVSGICWFLVFTIPMGKVTLLIFYHLRRHPLALSFHTDSHYGRVPSSLRGSSGTSILLCTYRAVGLKYWKYTIDGTNIFLINLLGLVAFVIFDYFVLSETLGLKFWLTAPGLVFVLALASIIPLAYFIGQAVASISAQSSMGVGATINAFFSTVVEVFLYCIALDQGKAQLVEGSIIGSIFAGILFLPGISMCFGALKRKTQRFNVKSAGVTSTMLLFAVIGAFGPTLFYQIYGSHELNCHQCVEIDGHSADRDCRRCYFAQVPAVHDRFFVQAVKPYIWFAAVCLFLSYVVGLLFTLRTHAAVIWNNEPDEKKEVKMEEMGRSYDSRHPNIVPGTGGLAVLPDDVGGARPGLGRGETSGTLPRENIRESVMYKRILNQSLKQAGLVSGSIKKDKDTTGADTDNESAPQTPFIVPPKPSSEAETPRSASVVNTPRIAGLSAEDNRALVQQVAEMAATAATVAARDATKNPGRSRMMSTSAIRPSSQHTNHHHHHAGSTGSKDATATAGAPTETILQRQLTHEPDTLLGAAAPPTEDHPASGGHDAPNWSRTKSAVILLTATVAYAIIAEILVDTVDAVLSNVDIDEKFLGITLFALVPNTTEFLNAISFAMNGNVALSMEIGSSYALQVMLLQIPCLVLFSEVYGQFIDQGDVIDHTFSMIFPQWDMVTVILGVFLMGWVVGEGKSNYFKGSILIFTYLVVTVGFWFSGYDAVEPSGMSRFDMAGRETFKTVGRSRGGMAW